MKTHQVLIVCADVGSVAKGRFGWADSEGSKGAKPSELAARVSGALSEKRSVALGFECPLYVPVPDAEQELGKGRGGEGRRSWSAGAGCAALSTGLVQAAWTLGEIRKRCPSSVRAYLDWNAFEVAGNGLLVWEAFVSGVRKGSDHVDDAAVAVQAFRLRLPRPETDFSASNPMSLAGFALLWSGWLISTEALRQPCIAIRA